MKEALETAMIVAHANKWYSEPHGSAERDAYQEMAIALQKTVKTTPKSKTKLKKETK